MIRRIFRYSVLNSNITRNCSNLSKTDVSESNLVECNPPQTDQVESEKHLRPVKNDSVLEPLDEDISHISPYLKPTFNFAAYINKSESLQELLKLGVDFHKVEKNVEAVPFLLGVKFADIKEHIIFFKNLGIETENIGNIISKNPLILKEDLENLKIRINYLHYKKFTDEMVLRIIEKNPHWLSHSTQEIDERLGFFQNQFGLSGNEVRLVTTTAPSLITYSVKKIKLNIFVIKEEMGFSQDDLKQILLSKPTILRRGQSRLLKTFEYLHKTMKIPLEKIVQTPEILTCRYRRLMERHLFLVKLGKDQYDSKMPNYVALTTLVSGTDSYFSTEVAKSSIQAYNAFLKSL